MRIIIEPDDEDGVDYIEIQLSEKEIQSLLDYDPIEKEIGDALGSGRNINIYIRRILYASEKR